MRFKCSLLLIALSLIPSAQAGEKDTLPMDLIELLGELEEDDLESLDEESLNATLHDANTSTNNRTNEIRRTNEVGGQ